MYKIIIWGTGHLYNQYINCIRMQEFLGNLMVQGVTSNERGVTMVDGYRFVPKKELDSVEYDCFVVAVRDFQAVLREAQSMQIDTQKCIPIRVFSIPFFDIAKYMKVKKAHISIISRNCFAGLCYNYLGLMFDSPFINMFFNDNEFNKLMKKFDYYLTVPLEFERMDFENNLKRAYPVGRLGDIFLHFNHYKSFEEAKACYDRRKQRINKENLIFISQTLSKNVEKEFDDISVCARKVIFVPWNSALKSSIRINYTDEEKNRGITIGMKSNDLAKGDDPLIDLLSFLNGEENFLRVQNFTTNH